MEIQCPKCSSRFNLPDSMAKEGRKLRCSVCKNIFVLEFKKEQGTIAAPKSEKINLSEPKKKEKKGKKLTILVSIAVFLLCLTGALLWEFVLKDTGAQISDKELAAKVKLLTMRNVRQYIVDNEKVGKVFVIEGRVVNEFPEPKELIKVEAAIYGKDKRVISTKEQLCGTQLSLFQLQVLGEKEMEAFLNNKIEILTNNVNVKHGAEVPFMVLFYTPPDDVAEFGVRILDVRDVPLKK